LRVHTPLLRSDLSPSPADAIIAYDIAFTFVYAVYPYYFDSESACAANVQLCPSDLTSSFPSPPCSVRHHLHPGLHMGRAAVHPHLPGHVRHPSAKALLGESVRRSTIQCLLLILDVPVGRVYSKPPPEWSAGLRSPVPIRSLETYKGPSAPPPDSCLTPPVSLISPAGGSQHLPGCIPLVLDSRQPRVR
jgi:hypothetical protein